MKKFIILISVLLLLVGCSSKGKEEVTEKKTDKEKVVPEEKVEDYIDYNNTPIGIYKLNGNSLTRLDSIDTTLVVEKDIGLFQIFPSNEEVVSLNKNFGEAYHDEWLKYSEDSNLKIGFNITFTNNLNEEISYNIFSPNETFEHWEQLMNYLYDDYANLGKGSYSHIENEEFNENTLITAFKMQSSYQCSEITSSIKLTVFTYDSSDDFDDKQQYRGNSSHTLTINIQ